MRQYAWYCIELDVIVLQNIMVGCEIAFEWDFNILGKIALLYGTDIDLMNMFTFHALGNV